jgi:acyl-CoA reductase-like NAD-dependent aldehyde dehydrogenase
MQLSSHNPADGSLVGAVEITPPEAVAERVAAARRAQPEWAALGAQGRAEVLLRAKPRFAERSAAIGELMAREMGKPIDDATGEARGCGLRLDHELAEMVEAFAPQELDDGRQRTRLLREAFGVCAAITPWNFPFLMPHWTALPALMAGNAVVLKPSEESPLTAQAWADLFDGVLPDGLLQVVHGAAEQGRALTAAPIDMVAFTGSIPTGQAIMRAAVPTMTELILELGGKDPLVVLPDADLDQAAEFAVFSSFRNTGQVCVSTERIYVDRSVAEAFLDRVVERTRALVVGDPLDPDVGIGPMVSAKQRELVLAQLDGAVRDGARIVAGGEGHHGNFVLPTVLTDLTHDMEIMREETFGPVACVMVADDVDHAVALANDTRFGLGAVVYGGDPDRTEAVALRLKAGMVGINRGVWGAKGSPWVGMKCSGLGFHGGLHGHRRFAQVRTLNWGPSPR